MKKTILIIAIMFAGAFTVAAYDLQEEETTAEYPHCGTPIDKNCNGIPDYLEPPTI